MSRCELVNLIINMAMFELEINELEQNLIANWQLEQKVLKGRRAVGYRRDGDGGRNLSGIGR